MLISEEAQRAASNDCHGFQAVESRKKNNQSPERVTENNLAEGMVRNQPTRLPVREKEDSPAQTSPGRDSTISRTKAPKSGRRAGRSGMEALIRPDSRNCSERKYSFTASCPALPIFEKGQIASQLRRTDSGGVLRASDLAILHTRR